MGRAKKPPAGAAERPADQPTLSPQIAQHVDDFLAERTSPNTRAAYRAALEEFLDGVEDVARLRSLDHRNVAAWRNTLVGRGLSRASVNLKLSAVRGFFDALVGLGLLSSNPAAGKLVRGYRLSGESKTRGLSIEEADALVAACEDGTLAGLRDRAIMYLGVVQGLRRGEIAGLRLEDLRVEAGQPVLILRNTKTSEFARQWLDARVHRVVEEYVAANPRRLGPRDPLFHSLSRNGGAAGQKLRPLSGWSVNEIVQRRARLAGIRGISAHSLRHACTTLALEAGMPLERVQGHLRHREPKTTIRYYRQMQELRPDVAQAIRIGRERTRQRPPAP